VRKSIYIMNNGELKREDNTLCLATEEGKRFIPVEDISEIHIFGEVDLNKRLLEFLSTKEVILHFYNYYSYYVGSFYPREHLNSGFMTVKQVECYLEHERRLELAKKIVFGAGRNIRQVLMYYKNRGKDVEDCIKKIEGYLDQIDQVQSIDTLMAYEGNTRDAYYSVYDTIIEDPDFTFNVRSKRPPKNQLNALIGFGNTLLYTTTLSEIYRTHLDPRIGYLHTSNYRRFTLNLDMAEIFKPIIIDRLIFSLIGRRIIKKNHFEKKLDGVILNNGGRNIFVQNYEQRMMSTFKHRELGREVSHRRLIRMELYKLEKHLMGEKEYEPFIARW
jgi:CRISPR-associated protein Cas1